MVGLLDGLAGGLEGLKGLLGGLVASSATNPLDTEVPEVAVQPRGPHEVDTGCEAVLDRIIVVAAGGLALAAAGGNWLFS